MMYVCIPGTRPPSSQESHYLFWVDLYFTVLISRDDDTCGMHETKTAEQILANYIWMAQLMYTTRSVRESCHSQLMYRRVPLKERYYEQEREKRAALVV
jgi:hypothetical protein